MSGRSDWSLGPFATCGEILGRDDTKSFSCPVSGDEVAWAHKDVFNPAAIVRDGRVHLLVRAEDSVGPYAGTSRVGHAISDDGLNFVLEPEPVLFPDRDPYQSWEWPGGCEDPRVVESPDGRYVCCYSAFDGKASSLFVATSDDLRHWTKHGPAFAGTPYERRWTKSGSIVTEIVDGRLVAARVNGVFVMYWGEGTCFAATSDDLVSWTPMDFDAGADRHVSHHTTDRGSQWTVHRVPGSRALRPLLCPRPDCFDALLVEPGPPAVRTPEGIVLIYNGAALTRSPSGTVTGVAYQPAQVLFDPHEPGSVLARATEPMSFGHDGDALAGQVSGVCFAQGLVVFEGAWWLYYGMGDSRIGVARATL